LRLVARIWFYSRSRSHSWRWENFSGGSKVNLGVNFVADGSSIRGRWPWGVVFEAPGGLKVTVGAQRRGNAMKLKMTLFALSVGAVGMAASSGAYASNTLFQQYVGNYGISTSGWGSVVTDTGTITATVPVGSTVTAAYLYTSTYTFGSINPGLTLNGSAALPLTALGFNTSACCSLQAYRTDVTSIVSPVINGGAGGTYNFTVKEADTQQQDGEALVVVYSNPLQAKQTVAILNGFASSAGDTSKVNFASPLDPAAPGFFAHMAIGDGFSCCNQESTITVNGQNMTTVAGNNDSSIDGFVSNGNLITVGNINGPFTGGTPGFPQTNYAADHEAYDLASFISKGDTQIRIDTINASHDDNIFLEVFDVSGVANVVTTPEPSTWAMMVLGFAGIGYAAMRRTRKARALTA